MERLCVGRADREDVFACLARFDGDATGDDLKAWLDIPAGGANERRTIGPVERRVGAMVAGLSRRGELDDERLRSDHTTGIVVCGDGRVDETRGGDGG